MVRWCGMDGYKLQTATILLDLRSTTVVSVIGSVVAYWYYSAEYLNSYLLFIRLLNYVRIEEERKWLYEPSRLAQDCIFISSLRNSSRN